MKAEMLKCKDCNMEQCLYRGTTCSLGRMASELPVSYTISDHDLKIYDSYEVKKKDFKPTLVAIEEREPNYAVWKRGKNQMCLELATHNALWYLHVLRDRTKDTDLDHPQPWHIRWAYAVAGCLVWIFIP